MERINGERRPDSTDERILALLREDARMSMSDLGRALGMSRTAVKKRVRRLEEEGVIRGYTTCISRPSGITVLIDLVTTPEGFAETEQYVASETACIRRIFRTTKANHLHIVAESGSAADLKQLIRMIEKDCGDKITELHCHAVREVIRDV